MEAEAVHGVEAHGCVGRDLGEELEHLAAGVVEVGPGDVAFIDEEDGAGGSGGGGGGSGFRGAIGEGGGRRGLGRVGRRRRGGEEADIAFLAVVVELEVFRLEAGEGMAVLVINDRAHVDEAGGDFERVAGVGVGGDVGDASGGGHADFRDDGLGRRGRWLRRRRRCGFGDLLGGGLRRRCRLGGSRRGRRSCGSGSGGGSSSQNGNVGGGGSGTGAGGLRAIGDDADGCGQAVVVAEGVLIDAQDGGWLYLAIGGVGRLLKTDGEAADGAGEVLSADGDAAVLDQGGGALDGIAGVELGLDGDAEDGAACGVDGDGAVVGGGGVKRDEFDVLGGVVGFGALRPTLRCPKAWRAAYSASTVQQKWT